MKITKEIIEKTAYLARLKFDSNEEESIKKDLQEMINWVDKLQEVDTEGVEPLTHMTVELNSLREDKAEHSISREDALQNGPKHDSKYFRVPKVIK